MKTGWFILALAGLGAAAMTKQGKQIVKTISEKKDLELEHFTASEFGVFYHLISTDVLKSIDAFRGHWGAPVMISPASGSIGRYIKEGAAGLFTSDHNILKWGEVRGLDVMPYGMVTPEDRRRAVEVAHVAGFNGIGVYPDWKPRPGLHLGVRDGAGGTWSAFMVDGQQQYGALSAALQGG